MEEMLGTTDSVRQCEIRRRKVVNVVGREGRGVMFGNEYRVRSNKNVTLGRSQINRFGRSIIRSDQSKVQWRCNDSAHCALRLAAPPESYSPPTLGKTCTCDAFNPFHFTLFHFTLFKLTKRKEYLRPFP